MQAKSTLPGVRHTKLYSMEDKHQYIIKNIIYISNNVHNVIHSRYQIRFTVFNMFEWE